MNITMLSTSGARRDVVTTVLPDNTVFLASHPDRPCDVLTTAGGELRLTPGDEVFAWLPDDPAVRGVILGRIGESHVPNADLRDELILEAREQIVLKVGDGTITIRDGRILIQGRDLVSDAKRLNRIRGGAVSIN
ncbi:MAG: hypothetical protein MUE41_05000 [Gemmatimonadaceae bacterium]|jgi:hypothetical protein|nr:hypothetical protein [Gemmatimonadaceae bacterium]